MKANWWDRFLISLAPKYGINRVRARETLRNYEAALPGHRTDTWARTAADGDLALRGALLELRWHSRDLIRNTAWARRAQRIVANNTVGTGVIATAKSTDPAVAKKAQALWSAWADTTECESEGRHTFAGLQHLAMKAVFESGEVLFRRRPRLPKDDLTIPIQIQVLEADFLDQSRNFLAGQGPAGLQTGPTIQGVEFDKLGRRTAYWIYPQHPGSGRNYAPSQRIPASEIIHVYYTERPGMSRGAPWLCAAIVGLKELDAFEDAALMRQKIAACFAAFITDMDGSGLAIGAPDPTNKKFEALEPGMIVRLPPGKQVTTANPPLTTDDGFTARTQRRIAAAIGVTYEEMTGDYSQVNFSSARMARIAHYASVNDWRWNMLIPAMCQGVWDWAMQAAVVNGEIPEGSDLAARWTAPPLPMIEPDKEGLAYQRQVRNGMMTHDEMIREMGGDPDAHWLEYAEGLKKLDALKIILDSDPRKTTLQGQGENLQAKAKPAEDAKEPT